MHLTENQIRSSYPMILCVDDDPCVVDSLGRMFRRYKVQIAKAPKRNAGHVAVTGG